MKTFKSAWILAIAVFMASAALGGSMSRSVPKGWDEDYEKARNEAKESGRLLLIAFSGSDWCGWCIKMERDIYSQKKFISSARKKFVLVMIDSPKDKTILSDLAKKQNPGLCSKFGIYGYPTSVVARPDGSEVKRYTGYQKNGVKAFLAELDKVAASAGVTGDASVLDDDAKNDDRFFCKPADKQKVLARETGVRKANLASDFALEEFAGITFGKAKADGAPVLAEPYGPLSRLEKPVYTAGKLSGFTLSATKETLAKKSKEQLTKIVCGLVREMEDDLDIKFAVTGGKIDFVGKATSIVVNFSPASGNLSVQFARKAKRK